MRWCVGEGLLDHDPTERLKLPKAEKKHIRVFTDDEVRLLHEACVPPRTGLRPDVQRMMAARNRAILWMLLDTGIRASELAHARFLDFDRKRGTLYIMGKGAKSENGNARKPVARSRRKRRDSKFSASSAAYLY